MNWVREELLNGDVSHLQLIGGTATTAGGEDITYLPHLKDRKVNPKGGKICLQPQQPGPWQKRSVPSTWPPDFLSYKAPPYQPAAWPCLQEPRKAGGLSSRERNAGEGLRANSGEVVAIERDGWEEKIELRKAKHLHPGSSCS